MPNVVSSVIGGASDSFFAQGRGIPGMTGREFSTFHKKDFHAQQHYCHSQNDECYKQDSYHKSAFALQIYETNHKFCAKLKFIL